MPIFGETKIVYKRHDFDYLKLYPHVLVYTIVTTSRSSTMHHLPPSLFPDEIYLISAIRLHEHVGLLPPRLYRGALSSHAIRPFITLVNSVSAALSTVGITMHHILW